MNFNAILLSNFFYLVGSSVITLGLSWLPLEQQIYELNPNINLDVLILGGICLVGVGICIDAYHCYFPCSFSEPVLEMPEVITEEVLNTSSLIDIGDLAIFGISGSVFLLLGIFVFSFVFGILGSMFYTSFFFRCIYPRFSFTSDPVFFIVLSYLLFLLLVFSVMFLFF